MQCIPVWAIKIQQTLEFERLGLGIQSDCFHAITGTFQIPDHSKCILNTLCLYHKRLLMNDRDASAKGKQQNTTTGSRVM